MLLMRRDPDRTTAGKIMPKAAKRFGINKQSKRRRKRKQSISDFVPLAVVPRCQAPVVYELLRQNTDSIEIDSSLRSALA